MNEHRRLHSPLYDVWLAQSSFIPFVISENEFKASSRRRRSRPFNSDLALAVACVFCGHFFHSRCKRKILLEKVISSDHPDPGSESGLLPGCHPRGKVVEIGCVCQGFRTRAQHQLGEENIFRFCADFFSSTLFCIFLFKTLVNGRASGRGGSRSPRTAAGH